jgi:hypothetical protein
VIANALVHLLPIRPEAILAAVAAPALAWLLPSLERLLQAGLPSASEAKAPADTADFSAP